MLEWTRGFFAEKGIESARLDAEVLLAHVLQKDRVYLYTHYDQPLVQTERDAYRALVQRRAKREPVSQVLGEREFFGRPFLVSRDVLTPRPETEHLIEAALEWAAGRSEPRILELGTGSGCIVTTLLAELPSATAVGVDISPAALTVTRKNAERHGVLARLTLRESDLFAEVGNEPFDLIVSNPPYIPTSDKAALMPEVRDYEPGLALFAGEDGLDIIRRIVDEAPKHLRAPAALMLEMGAGQWPAVQALLAAAGFTKVRAVNDLAGYARIAIGER